MKCFSVFLVSYQIISHKTPDETNACVAVVFCLHVKTMLLLHNFMFCYFLHLLLMNIMLYVTHTLLNMYLILFRFTANTNIWLEKFAYSTRHIISRYSAALSLIRPVAEPRPQWLGFQLGPQFDIRYRQVELVQVFIQLLLFSPVSTLPQMLHIYAILCILITL